MKILRKNLITIFFTYSILFFCIGVLNAQNMKLVWADEFNDADLNQSMWNYEIGPTAETLHYFTDHPENTKIVDGKLQLIALKEDYEGFHYTASLIKTENIYSFRYGRIEASIKLPQTTGFVPGFWLLPQDSQYGYWPWSGEIDVMEHPTNQDKIYGTCHSWQYSYFTGSMQPAGGNIQVIDSETEFHIYAVEWSPEKIDFFVDDQKYFTYNNDLSGDKSWPFDQPFYILLAMGVGGGWVGPPNESTVFPSIMEVDYVRVYQALNDVSISGEDNLPRFTKGESYALPNLENALYSWNVSSDAEIVSGQNTNKILVDWNEFSGDVECNITLDNLTYNYKYPVNISNNYFKNYGFEKGVAHWNYTRPYPGDIAFILDSQNSHNGNNCLLAEVQTSSVNAWDVQLSQRDLLLKAGKMYSASFWAKTKISGTKISAAIINSNTFAPFAIKEFTLTDAWAKYDLSFTPSTTVVGQFNIDMGGHIGSYYFDDFTLSLPELNSENQILNADFSNGKADWVFNSFAPAQAIGEVRNGEFSVSISNGGANLWDIHLGQPNVICENGKEYLVSFDAYAEQPRTISALVGKNSDPWTVYSGNQIISLTKDKLNYSFSFKMNSSTDNKARFGFDLGKSSVDVYFDNITLSKGVIPTKVDNGQNLMEKYLALFQNYPNPFNPATEISFNLPNRAFTKLVIYDILGKEIRTLLSEVINPGIHSIEFDASNLPSGVYYYTLSAGELIQTRKMLLLK